MGIFSLLTGAPGPNGYGSSTTAEQVTEGIDATNLTIIITGGARGLGLETARILALRNAQVIIAARSIDAAIEARNLILEEKKDARVNILKLDLLSVASIREFVSNFNALHLPLNVLINNAAVAYCSFKETEYGAESQFATNHLGHFLLTKLLLDNMKETARTSGIQGRIVILSSLSHGLTYREGIRFGKINNKKSYSFFKAYGQSKLANLLHAKELSRRLEKENANITVNAIHPGIIATDITKDQPILCGAFRLFTFPIWKNLSQGTATICHAAIHPGLQGVTGKYLVDCNVTESSKQSNDEALAKELWDFSEKLVAGGS